MLVTLWRHGEAGSAARDADRTLTTHGVSHVMATAGLFKNWCHQSDIIAPSICTHSPLVRTRQTAALLHEALAVSMTKECEKLAPGHADYVQGLFLEPNCDHQLVVGHQPYLSHLINVWCDSAAHSSLHPSGFATMQVTLASRGGAELLHCEPLGYHQ
ncbi:MAG: histidine phosphatase family protein [Luminiphilus sp.]|nr:histidine phosphatase family protein [Luminiphilus sp.]